MAKTEAEADDEITAAMAFGYMASAFVVEAESWPVFHRWIIEQYRFPPDFSREHALELLEILAIGMASMVT